MYIYVYIYVDYSYTARRCVLPGKFKWRSSIILQHAQTPAQGQSLEISQATNPKRTKTDSETPPDSETILTLNHRP